MSQVSPLIPWPFELHDGPSPDLEALHHWQNLLHWMAPCLPHPAWPPGLTLVGYTWGQAKEERTQGKDSPPKKDTQNTATPSNGHGNRNIHVAHLEQQPMPRGHGKSWL